MKERIFLTKKIEEEDCWILLRIQKRVASTELFVVEVKVDQKMKNQRIHPYQRIYLDHLNFAKKIIRLKLIKVNEMNYLIMVFQIHQIQMLEKEELIKMGLTQHFIAFRKIFKYCLGNLLQNHRC